MRKRLILRERQALTKINIKLLSQIFLRHSKVQYLSAFAKHRLDSLFERSLFAIAEIRIGQKQFAEGQFGYETLVVLVLAKLKVRANSTKSLFVSLFLTSIFNTSSWSLS